MKIRKLKYSDLDDMFEVLSDPDVMKYIEPVYSRDKTSDFLNAAGLSDNPLIYAAENDEGEFVGYVIFHDYDNDSMEIGWLLKKKYWGRGYAKALTRILLDKCRQSGKKAVIECDPGQEITGKIAENAGFEYKGIDKGLCLYLIDP